MKKLQEDFYNQKYDPKTGCITSENSSLHKHITEIFKSLRYPIDKKTQFLDGGGGDGNFALEISKALNIPKENMYVIDISQEAVNYAKSKGLNGYSLNLENSKLPFKENTIDLAFYGCVLPHLYNPDYLLNELKRVLKEKGVAIISAPNNAAWFNRLAVLLGKNPAFTDASLNYSFDTFFNTAVTGHLRPYTVKSLSKLMEAHGFKIINCIGVGINTKFGYGRRFGILTKMANFIFSKNTLSPNIHVIVAK